MIPRFFLDIAPPTAYHNSRLNSGGIIMKQQPQLADMIKSQMFDGFLLTRAATQRTSSNGS